MKVWERLLSSGEAHHAYMNSPLFHQFVNMVRVVEEEGKADTIASLGELLATVCNSREAWVKEAARRLMMQTRAEVQG